MSRKKYDETFKRQIIHEYETGGISCYSFISDEFGAEDDPYGKVMLIYRKEC